MIGEGGFGRVHLVRSGARECAAKLIPKAPGAEREMLFADVADAPNVVSIIDSGETADHWVLVMPLAETSLRRHLEDAGGKLSVPAAVPILADIATALAALAGRVVHRDLKPENVLLLDGRWCLADFGIARYAEATTAADTKKHQGTALYVAPERWREERATSAADVYSLGVLAYELLSGTPPFVGREVHEIREQHLHRVPPPLHDSPVALATLVEECLLKAPAARPAAADIGERLRRLSPTTTPGHRRLQNANRAEVRRVGELSRDESRERSAAERRADLVAAARTKMARCAASLQEAILGSAPSTRLLTTAAGQATLRLGEAQLSVGPPAEAGSDPWDGWPHPSFTVIAYATITLSCPPDRSGYVGRSHSLWYCDAQQASPFGWYETAFAFSAPDRRQGGTAPVGLPPGDRTARALWGGISEYRVAWRFRRMEPGDLDEFTDRWAGWLADASLGRLERPRYVPLDDWRP
ncbi:serine/threonine-protein kinase [Actinomadura bangladeshensis]|uniref:serine/threonine-protein kinase n=1 Tax=Actinomadura bangladeshensis TaxID=453573 RepID=UPI001A9DECA1|nr:serine/threonine-protein kinase [Actinomadura bangladeshensis]